MSDSVATRNSEVAGNSLVDTVIVRFSVRVIKVAVIECLGVIGRVFIVVGSGSRFGELVILVDAGGLDIVCVRIVVDSESVMDLSAVTDNSDTVGSLAVDVGNVLVGYSVLAKSGIETDESVRDFKVIKGLMVGLAD